MAKDGTNRGGARVGAGRKAKPLSEKIVEGKAKNSPKKSKKSNEAAKKPLRGYLTAKQKNGIALCAEEIAAEVWEWLGKYKCEQSINPHLVELYAMSFARWVQCEEAISKEGLTGKHPTTGAPIASPYVTMSQTYVKQINQAWYQIMQYVKENSSTKITEVNPQNTMMEKLLAGM